MNEPSDQPRDPALSRLYRANPGAEPPPQLDQAILAAARAAAKPASARPTSWWRRLRAPLALAATVMLTVMLSLTVDRNPPRVEESPAPSPRQAAPEAPAPAAASGDMAKPAPAPALEAKKAAPASSAAKPQALPAQPPALRDEAPAPPPATSAPGAAGLSTEAETTRRMQAERRSDMAAPAERAAKQGVGVITPETWLEEIRALRRQGRLAEAERRLQEFRRTFPDYALPDDLR